MKKTLIYGYGNPGRQDDGLGVILAEKFELWANEKEFKWLNVDSNYQLNIEDASTVSEYERVIFVDASKEDSIESCLLENLQPSARIEFTMHSVSPAFILHLCESIFNKRPEAWLLHIKGFEWELNEGLSPEASQNLEVAMNKLKIFIASDCIK